MGLNQYTELLNYLKSLGDADNFVNTVTKDGEAEIDLQKGNIYTLLDITVGETATFPSTGVAQFSVELICVAQRDTNKETITDKFWKQDNEVDNHNETFSVLNRMWVRMNKDFDENDMIASDNPTIEKITLEYMNLMDGWKMNFNVDVPNTTLNLCT